MHAKIHSWVRSNPVEALGTWIQPTGGGREPTLEDIVAALKRTVADHCIWGDRNDRNRGGCSLGVKGSSGRMCCTICHPTDERFVVVTGFQGRQIRCKPE
jgi:hypothetical protein